MGELLAEFLSRNPHQKFTQPGEFIGPFPSGAPAIFAAQVAKLCHRAIFFGCVGNDDFARLIIERLRHEGVITDGIHVMNNAVTGTAFVSYQNPQQRDFVFVTDVARANLLAATADGSGIYNIGSGVGTDVNTIFAGLKQAAGYAQDARYGPGKLGEVYKIYLDASKAKRELGWEATVSVVDGLRRTVDYFRRA